MNELDGLTSLSRSSDHLGNLANILKDLAGGATLLYELTQNANDAKADRIRFTVSDDELTVWNSGVFSDCGHQRTRERCPWRVDEGRRSCDLHSFRQVAGRHKADDDTTTGAFGVGFTAVYQVTDHPELVTNERHLVLDELQAADARIQICDGGCERDHSTPGTTFYLPWARERTKLRRELGTAPLDEEDIRELIQALHEAAGSSLVFLEHVECLDVSTPGRKTKVTRERTDDIVTLTLDGARSQWLLLEGIAEGTEELRARYDQEGSRSARVQVAVPLTDTVVGRVYADLPTETMAGWSGHINASFFPRQDRKTVEFDGSGFRGRWNDLLVDAAAQVVAENIETIASRLDHAVAWSYLVDAELIHRGIAKSEHPKAFGAFYARAKAAVPNAPIALLADGRSIRPAGSIVPRDDEEYEAVDVLLRLGLPILDPSIRPQVLQVTRSEFGIRQLTAAHVVGALRDNNVVAPWSPTEESVLTNADVESILRLLNHFQDRGKAVLLEAGADSVAIVPCDDGSLASANDVCRLDSDDRALFELLDSDLKVLDEPRLADLCPALSELCEYISPARAIEIFERDHDALGVAPGEVLQWLDDHRAPLHDESIRERVRALPIFPTTGGGHKPLTELSLASQFEDVLGVADLVDRRLASGHEDLLRLLGAKQLDAVEYLTRHVIPTADAGSLDVALLRQVLEIIHSARPALENRTGAKDRLSRAPLVLCTDGEARAAVSVHIANPALALISPDEPTADTSGLASHLVETLCWLGVSEVPSSQVLAAAATRLASGNEDPPHDVVLAILDALPTPLPASVPRALQPLVAEAWLPVEGGGRAAPPQVYAAFRREIFESQGPRLGLSRVDQNVRAQELEWIGVHSTPTTAMVLAHLRHCVQQGEELNGQVYRALAEAKRDAHLVESLRGEACVQVQPGEFAEPGFVFWNDPGLGKWAHLLEPSYRQYQQFFDLVGVRDAPSPSQVEQVLRRMSRSLGNDPLQDADRSVVHRCWEMLDEQLGDESTEADAKSTLARLRHVRSALDARGMLDRPEMLLFVDGRRLAEKLELVRNNLIRRDRTTQRALTEVGVRAAEDVIETLVDQSLPGAPAEQLFARVTERMPAIRRLVESHREEDVTYDVTKLTGVEFLTVPDLLVRFRIRFAHREETTHPERADAVLLDEQRRLLVRSQAPSRHLARELARCMNPAADVSLIAPSLHEVLSADTLDQAMEVLNEYGVRDLDETPWEHVATQVSEAGDAVGSEQGDNGQAGQADLGHAGEGPAPETGSVQDAENRAGRQGGSASLDGGTSRRTARRKGSGPPRAQMASFVSFDDDDEALDAAGDESAPSSPVDVAGVRRVLEYEQSCGRFPKEQAHNNPGFDVLSFDAEGNVLRRIEVKSIGGPWTGFGVWMSSTQMEENRTQGDSFWLYVVEHADDDDAVAIHRLNNPVKQATKYGFDAGWQALREPDIERDAAGKPLVGSTRHLLGWGGTQIRVRETTEAPE